jgi:hypothetical protein
MIEGGDLSAAGPLSCRTSQLQDLSAAGSLSCRTSQLQEPLSCSTSQLQDLSAAEPLSCRTFQLQNLSAAGPLSCRTFPLQNLSAAGPFSCSTSQLQNLSAAEPLSCRTPQGLLVLGSAGTPAGPLHVRWLHLVSALPDLTETDGGVEPATVWSGVRATGLVCRHRQACVLPTGVQLRPQQVLEVLCSRINQTERKAHHSLVSSGVPRIFFVGFNKFSKG